MLTPVFKYVRRKSVTRAEALPSEKKVTQRAEY